MDVKKLSDQAKEVIMNIRGNIGRLGDSAQTQGIQTMERLTYFQYLIESGASEDKIKKFIESGIQELGEE